MITKPRTTCLFHFTESLDILCKILKEGFWPQYSLEDIAWLNGPVPRLAWPMVSFCDIPITRLHDHTKFYGCYGIGLWREQLIPTGVSPVTYVTEVDWAGQSGYSMPGAMVAKLPICVVRLRYASNA
jgi:hypothetical protein